MKMMKFCLYIIRFSDQLGSFLYDIVSSIPVRQASVAKPDLDLLFKKLAREVGFP